MYVSFDGDVLYLVADKQCVGFRGFGPRLARCKAIADSVPDERGKRAGKWWEGMAQFEINAGDNPRRPKADTAILHRVLTQLGSSGARASLI
jgi:hypothetical protein